MEHRVVITGIGVITPAGIGDDQLWRSIELGLSGTRDISGGQDDSCPVTIAARVDDFDPCDYLNRKWIARTERSAQFAIGAAKLAYEDAQLSTTSLNPRRVGVFEGTSLGSINANLSQQREMLSEHSLRVSPSCLLKGMTGSSSGDIALEFHLQGPAMTFSMGSVSSAYAIGYAFRKIKNGELDAVFAGGSEAPISKEILALFSSTHLLSIRNAQPATAFRPFDVQRDGFVMGEGGVFLFLEDRERALERDAHIYAEVAGFGETTDAYHPTTPEPEGIMISDAMEQALCEAGVTAEQVQYVNAHGTATQVNDVVETKAIRRVFGENACHLAVSSTKPITGHLLGACGAAEVAICALAIEHQWIPPTINLVDPDPACDLDYVPQEGRHCDLFAVMSNNYSFGGRNSSIVLKRCLN